MQHLASSAQILHTLRTLRDHGMLSEGWLSITAVQQVPGEASPQRQTDSGWKPLNPTRTMPRKPNVLLPNSYKLLIKTCSIKFFAIKIMF